MIFIARLRPYGRLPVASLALAAVAMLSLPGCTSAPASPNVAAQAAPPVQPGPASVGDEVSAVTRNKVEVTFPQGGAVLTAEANRQLDIASRLFRDANPVLMFTTGYSDRVGDEYGNLLLSARRAQAVKRGLVARGIPADRLLIQAMGESEQVDTSNAASPRNRRVVITWRLI